jgi:hypothetical protein
MDLEPRNESNGVSGELFHFFLSCCLFSSSIKLLKKEGVGVYCLIMDKLARNNNPLHSSKREKSVLGQWMTGVFMGDYFFPPLSTTAHWRGVGGRAETKRKHIKQNPTKARVLD